MRANEMIQHTLLSRGLLIAICLTPSIASADDFAPPPWPRAHPHAVTAEWEFLVPPAADPAPPDGPLTNVSVKGSGTAPGGTTADIFGDSGWGGTSGGNWFFPPSTFPQGMRFRVDNVIDFEPVKHIRLQVTHTPGLGLFVDPLPGFNLAETGSTPGPVTGPVSFSSGGLVFSLFTWDMFPNPPWEDFILGVTGGGEIRQVVVDTISIPEPSAFVLCAIALSTLGMAFRRRLQ